MALVKYREATVDPEHLENRPLALALPVSWVRDHLKPGDKVALFIDSDDQTQFFIKVNFAERAAQ